jgi:hypothetical protein
MAEEATPDVEGGGGTGALARTPLVFVADPSAEAERIADTLRSAGYAVVDVPLSLLASRAGAQRPNVVLVDGDADRALDAVRALRRQPGSGAIDVVYLGTGAGPIANADDALAEAGSAFFLRPVDIGALVRKIEALTGGPAVRPNVRPSTPPPSLPPSRGSAPLLPSVGIRTPGPPLPMSTTSLADLMEPPRSLATFGTVSNELQQLLVDAERRADVASDLEAALPSPEEEIEAVLPADVLASLDEPIEGEDDDDGQDLPRTGAGLADREGTGAHAKGTTVGGTRPPTTGSGRGSTGARTHERRAADAPLRGTPVLLPENVQRPSSEAPREGAGARLASWAPTAPPPDVPRRAPPLAPAQPAEAAPPAAVLLLGPGDARRFVAQAIARRASGALCFDGEGVVRRIVVRDGDLVTAGSGGEHESLVHYLAARGELPRDDAARLADKVPPHGRHAGAALIAHGCLRQDQLWDALRGHAEWIAQLVLRLPSGTAQLEPDPPGRLRSEPSVFAASTGPEIFVELVRRAVAPEEALSELGGHGSRIGDGVHARLLAECALGPAELDVLSRARGGTVGDLLARSADAEIVCVVHALALLEIVCIIPAPDFAHRDEASVDPDVAALDEGAIRARVRARLELVEEGDYFAVLGIARDATSYEVRRAFLELRRAFEPSRILTPQLEELAGDVRKIVVVLEEAYEILRDPARRERYRRAIEARPD